MSAEARVEFQVVLLAGGHGNRMYPLTYGQSKCLLPVANRPLIAYPLDILQRSGFNKVIVVVEKCMADGVQTFLASENRYKLVDLVVLDGPMGTLDVLRTSQIRSRLTTDFFVMSGDTVTNVFLHYLADMHRSRDASFTALLHHLPKQEVVGKEKTVSDATDMHYFGLDSKGQRLLLVRSASDVEDTFSIKKSLLRRHSDMVVHNDLQDSHLYLFAHWVLDLIADKPRMSSLQAELVPYLVKNQFNPKLQNYMSCEKNMDDPSSSLHEMNHHSRPTREQETYRCFAVIAADSTYCARANTVMSYHDMNKKLGSGTQYEYTPWTPVSQYNKLVEAQAENPKAQLGQQCVIGQGLACGDHTSVKKSIVGNQVKMGSGVKLAGCVIHDDVVIGDGCNLLNTIVCQGAIIGDKCVLKDCRVGKGFLLEYEGEEYKNEIFAADPGM